MNRGFREGMLTHMLNPWAILFYISLLVIQVSQETPMIIRLLYSLIMATTYLGWNSFVNFFLTREVLRNRYYSVSHWIQRVLGVWLIYISINMFFKGF